MTIKTSLHGEWSFKLDREQVGVTEQWYAQAWSDTICLPTTVSEAKKTEESAERFAGYLTDPYAFSGFAWYAKTINIDTDLSVNDVILFLERTRISHVWVDNNYVGTQDSFCAAHRYDLTNFITSVEHRVTVMVDNANYAVSGGHMTSPDTQTNWNGILGKIELQYLPKKRINHIRVDTEWETATVKAALDFSAEVVTINAYIKDDTHEFGKQSFVVDKQNPTITYQADAPIQPWSEHTPQLYTLVVELLEGDDVVESYEELFGFRSFITQGNHFFINNQRAYLRGKHDGLIFPMTGYAPMDVDSWLAVLGTAKSYGINHYRFHTCCPPDAAFVAADMLGIYMEPELPFWGTVTDENDENHDEVAQQYLIAEGYRMLKTFGNHPSFVMMSLGNELWGSKERLNRILGDYKAFDNTKLYTQGSNNYQFVPTILENDDFHVGVRFSRDRLFRGSYAMCDAPLGHLQTKAPTADYDYDEMICPSQVNNETLAGGTIEIQYGTGVKVVQAEAGDEIVPMIPVVSHEVGQYNMYPDYREIERYTGVLKARNFEVFRERLAEAGMLEKAHDFFMASGRFAAECYQLEIETALRTDKLSGFQLLDLQDFTGQGTALVGILNSFMKNKGVISQQEWATFCADEVLLARFPTFVFAAGETIDLSIQLYQYAKKATQNPKLQVALVRDNVVVAENQYLASGNFHNGLFDLATHTLNIPQVTTPEKLIVSLKTNNITKQYPIWVYPKAKPMTDAMIAQDFTSAKAAIQAGQNVLYIVKDIEKYNNIEGTYCTDFWNYTMFSSISRSQNKPEPIGTLGLLIDTAHPALADFPTEMHTTPQWYDIIEASSSLVLDNTAIQPIVQTIDNVERNHKLGLLFEVVVDDSKVLVCTSDLLSLEDSLPAQQLLHSLTSYVNGDKFQPKQQLSLAQLSAIFS